MAYKIGTRVKKVAGTHNIGLTGVVCNGPAAGGWTLDSSGTGADIYILTDCPWTGKLGNQFPSATVCMAYAEQWTPIIPDGHRDGVKGECSLLDELLSRENNNETVK
jgi:hypothetical protein